MNENIEIIRPPKIATYGFQWRVILEDGLYQLQRFSKEYRTWFSVKSTLNQEEVIKMYNDLGE